MKTLRKGMTTVCHHNPYDPLFDDGFPVCVVRRLRWARSMIFGDDVSGAFDATDRELPYVIHLGEGTDKAPRTKSSSSTARAPSIAGQFSSTVSHSRGLVTLFRNGVAPGLIVHVPTSEPIHAWRGVSMPDSFPSGEGRAWKRFPLFTARSDLLDEIRAPHDEERHAGGRRLPDRHRIRHEEDAPLERWRRTVRPGSVAHALAILPSSDDFPPSDCRR